MSEDLIKRSDAIEALKGREGILHDAYTAVAIIRAVPSADRPQGEWVHSHEGTIAEGLYCSNCGKHGYGQNFCPNCGARMKRSR